MENSVTVYPVDVSGIEVKHVKERYLAISLVALKDISASAISACIKSAAKYVAKMVDNHATPTGSDVKRTVKMWQSRQSVSMLIALFRVAGFEKPSDASAMTWGYASKTGAQRSGNNYLALKAQDKLLALAAWILSGDSRTAWNKNKYLVSIVVACEVLNVDKVDNELIYSVYQSHSATLQAMTKDCDADLRKRLMDAQLYKSAATASTQRTTSANLLQLLGAGVNAGNDRVIHVDRDSSVYQALRVSLFGDGPTTG